MALFNYPVLAVVDALSAAYGPILLPAYLFAVWVFAIVGMALLMHRRVDR
ncbi:MAG: hypothetical protein H6851_10145 [Geminicoccaceae bacterium]|nr:hypothetical protein [Geminicoccaceae bacterium]MCB9943967.1 hypothetical protein [Geminicoccaceae bacterium]